MKISIESLRLHLPRYLSEARQQGIKKALEDFPEIKFWYLNAYQDEILQGDCWSGLTALNFENGARKKIRGVVLSNSCSVDPANSDRLPAQLVFVPLLRVNTLEAFLAKQKQSPEQIASIVAAIRRQEIDNFFFFPKSKAIDSDSVAWFDQVHTMPVNAFLAEVERKKMTTLTDASFYLFAFKLSIYFCRLHEDVDRSEAVQAAE
jgi:hypothetical protein